MVDASGCTRSCGPLLLLSLVGSKESDSAGFEGAAYRADMTPGSTLRNFIGPGGLRGLGSGREGAGIGCSGAALGAYFPPSIPGTT